MQRDPTFSSRPPGSGLWVATVVLLAALVVGGIVLALLAPMGSGAVSGGGRLVIGLFLTIVPALLWLWLFYQQDRLEPEPHAYVLGVFILGTLLGGAVEQPLVREVYAVQDWVAPGSGLHLIASILLYGILTAALVYSAVRFTVMPTAEFDERADGIIYGTAAALGLGVASNLTYLLENGTVSLGVGALYIIITSLVYATFGAIVGYFLGLIKPGGGPAWLAPLGILIAGILQGLYIWLEAQLGSGDLTFNPWPALVSSAIFASLMFALVFYLLRRSHQPVQLQPHQRGG